MHKITPKYIREALKKKHTRQGKALLALELSFLHWQENLALAKEGKAINRSWHYCACCYLFYRKGFDYGGPCLGVGDCVCPLSSGVRSCCGGHFVETGMFSGERLVQACKVLAQYIKKRQWWYQKQCTTQP